MYGPLRGSTDGEMHFEHLLMGCDILACCMYVRILGISESNRKSVLPMSMLCAFLGAVVRSYEDRPTAREAELVPSKLFLPVGVSDVGVDYQAEMLEALLDLFRTLTKSDSP